MPLVELRSDNLPNPPRNLSTLARLRAPQTSTFTVNFNPASCTGVVEPWPAEARDAFSTATAIWGSILESPVPIEVNACWKQLGSGVLGSAGAATSRANFTNAPINNTWYPIALANSIAGRDLAPANPDINANFNSQFSNWYFGTDGNPAFIQNDFVSVVLHEIGHGLGFAGSMQAGRLNGTLVAQWGGGGSTPFIYDRFVENGNGQAILNTALFPNTSAALYQQVTSGQLFFDGPQSRVANGGNPVSLYAPSNWNQGSSYSHLGESFNNTGEALMTYSLSNGEVQHVPGPVIIGLLGDLGWSTTSSSSTPTPIPTNTATPIPTNTATPVPTNTATPIPANTATPIPADTATPIPANTATSIPADTATPIPANTATPIPANTATPIPADTATPIPANTATPTTVGLRDSIIYLPIVSRPFPTFSVSGRITDNNNNPLSGVTVSANNGRTTSSDGNGMYLLGSLPSGTYTIVARKADFLFASKSVQIDANVNNLNFLGSSTITPTTTPVPTSAPSSGGGNNGDSGSESSCGQLIQNGDFESNSSWVIPATEYMATYSDENVYSGRQAMRVGISNPADNRFSYSSIAQTINVPSNATSVELTYEIYSISTGVNRSNELDLSQFDFDLNSFTANSFSTDAQITLIIDQWGRNHLQVAKLSNANSWEKHEFEIGGFRGQTIQVYFGVFNNGFGGVTGAFIDEVSVTCSA